MSNPQQPHGLQPSRLLHPWAFPGKSTGVGCHCLFRTDYFMSNTLWPHGLQYSRFPCPLSPSLHWWWHSTISSSVVCCFSCLQSFPELGSFPMSWHFSSSGQNIVASDSTSALPMSIQCWFPLGLTSLIFRQSKGLSRVFSSTTVQNHQFFGIQPSLWSNSHIHTWLLEKR